MPDNDTQNADESSPDPSALVEGARGAVEELVDALGDGDGGVEDAVEAVEAFLRVVEEAEELLETVDVTEAAKSVDPSELPEAVDTDALSEGEVSGAVDLKRLHRLVELGEVWKSVDVREFWRNKRELDDAVTDLVGDEAAEEGDSIVDEVGGDGVDVDVSLDDSDEIPTEAIQTSAQQRIAESLDEFRETVLDARDRLEVAIETAQEQVPERDSASSRNPTAVSLAPRTRKRLDVGIVGRTSTVPTETRYSTAPNFDRIVGRRLRQRGKRDE
ncbi:hypothetical protein ACFQPA_03180 [Halomarina halobia]|uniref:Uncharacterized protein n=1 Tax=Halomarina halobia TaxID=3033386 RepID=A0ABD6A484_9EURY|nr:hypothetical protein [Halomarina sp. PSR21]